MALTTVNRVINGSNYAIGTLPLLQGQAVFVRLAKHIGPALGELLAGAKSVKSLLDTSTAALGPAIQDFCLRLNEQDLQFVIDAFAEVCALNNIPLKAAKDAHFPGRYGELFEWLGACISHNYGDFLRPLTNGLASSGEPLAAPTPAKG